MEMLIDILGVTLKEFGSSTRSKEFKSILPAASV
jgi:hypothetical protein